jgi:RimJ/RimL family protein N-acetyltransferase
MNSVHFIEPTVLVPNPAPTLLPNLSAEAAPARRARSTEQSLVRFEPFTEESAEIAGRWLEDENNYKWLDFGAGRQSISGRTLYYMSKSKDNFIRSMVDGNGRQVGVIGLQHVTSPFRNAMLWGVRPRLRPPTRGHAWIEIKEFLGIGFNELQLHSVYAWVAESNRLSLATLARAGFRTQGRQRCAHVVDGVVNDRILLDILAVEYEPFTGGKDVQ